MGTFAKKFVRPWVVMPLVAVLAVGGWWLWFRPDDNNAGAATSNDQVVNVTQGPMARTVSADGTIAAAQTDDLNFTSAGTVTAVNVKAGQAVKAGQVLATIDSAALQAAVANAESSVSQAQAKLADDQDAGASSEQIAADESALASQQDNLTSAQSDLAGAQLVATFDGTVAAVNVSVGEQLTNGGTGGTGQTGSNSGSGNSSSSLPSGNSNNNVGGNNNGSNGNNGSNSSSTPDVQVVSTSSFTVDLGFDSTDIGNIKVGQSASVTLSTASTNNRGGGGGGLFRQFVADGGFGGTAPNGGGNANAQNNATAIAGTQAATGKVTAVGTIASASSGVASYPVTVAFTDTSGEYHAGANSTVAITYSEITNAIQVPTFAVTTDNGTSTVVVRTNGHDQTRTVMTGERANGMVQITSGLQAGEQVVIRLPSFGNRTAANGNRNGNGGTGENGGPSFGFGGNGGNFGGNGGNGNNGKGG